MRAARRGPGRWEQFNYRLSREVRGRDRELKVTRVGVEGMEGGGGAVVL